MAEWLIEEGIGEDRAILVSGNAKGLHAKPDLLAARVDWKDGSLACGLVADAKLTSRRRGMARGTALFPNGEEALVSNIPADASEGATMRLMVTRSAIAEDTRSKLAQARFTTAAPRPAPSLAEMLREQGEKVTIVHRFPGGLWDGLLSDAFSREVSFADGALLFHPTAAMLLIDIDGVLDPRSLALAAVNPLAAALRYFDVGGSIGIDFPSLATRQDRQAVDTALADALQGWPHERTSMNGFGFVQLVSRLSRPSLLHRAMHQPFATAARWLLRKAEMLDGPGDLLLLGNPGIEPLLHPEWLADLARRTGRTIRFDAQVGLAPEACHAQLVTR